MMAVDLDNQQIRRRAASVFRVGRLAAPDPSAIAHSRLCGSRISINLKLKCDVITDHAHELRACLTGQAVASVIAKVVVGLTVGLTVDEVDDGAGILSAVLQDKTFPSPGAWAELEPFLPMANPCHPPEREQRSDDP